MLPSLHRLERSFRFQILERYAMTGPEPGPYQNESVLQPFAPRSWSLLSCDGLIRYGGSTGGKGLCSRGEAAIAYSEDEAAADSDASCGCVSSNRFLPFAWSVTSSKPSHHAFHLQTSTPFPRSIHTRTRVSPTKLILLKRKLRRQKIELHLNVTCYLQLNSVFLSHVGNAVANLQQPE